MTEPTTESGDAGKRSFGGINFLMTSSLQKSLRRAWSHSRLFQELFLSPPTAVPAAVAAKVQPIGKLISDFSRASHQGRQRGRDFFQNGCNVCCWFLVEIGLTQVNLWQGLLGALFSFRVVFTIGISTFTAKEEGPPCKVPRTKLDVSNQDHS